MQHSKGITVGTYTVKTKKKVNSLPICPTCKKCKDRKICSNRKNFLNVLYARIVKMQNNVIFSISQLAQKQY